LFSLFAAGASLYRAELRQPVRGGPIFLVLSVLVALMIGLRLEVGGDWLNYMDMLHESSFRDLSEVLALVNQDPGYAILNWLATRLGAGIWLVNLVCAALFVWGVTRFARREPNPWLVIVVAIPYLIIVVGMGYTRQAVAIGLMLAGLTVLDRGLVRFMIYMACAAAFHKSAVVVLPLVALAPRQNRGMTVLIMLASTVVLYYAFLQASMDRLVTNYVDAEYAAQGATIRVAMNVPPAVLFLLFRRRFATDEQGRLWRNFSLASMAAVAILYFTTATAAVDRLALYLIPLQMFVLARLPFAFPERQRSSYTLTALVIAYSALIQFVWLNYAVNASSWVPYKVYGLSESKPRLDS
jgi:hypothetical protein